MSKIERESVESICEARNNPAQSRGIVMRGVPVVLRPLAYSETSNSGSNSNKLTVRKYKRLLLEGGY